MAIKQLGKQPHQLIKRSPIPFCMAVVVMLFAMMALWRLHPSIFGGMGERLHDLVRYAPLWITGLVFGGMVLSWIVMLMVEYDAGTTPENVKHHYSTALFCVFVMGATVLAILFWMYFNGVAYYRDSLGEIQPENMDISLTFRRLPIIITLEIALGFLMFKQFSTMMDEKLSRHAWHLLIALFVLAVIVLVQFLYLGIVQSQMPIQGLLGDMMMLAMYVYAIFTGVIVIGVVLCLVRMALGRYQSGHDFSMTLLREIWLVLCLLWGITMLGIIIWQPVLV